MRGKNVAFKSFGKQQKQVIVSKGENFKTKTKQKKRKVFSLLKWKEVKAVETTTNTKTKRRSSMALPDD